MLEVVTLKEIDAIFAVTDALGIHREMLVIPLGPASPGRVRRLPSGKLEIIVDAARPIEEWVKELPKLIAAAQGTRSEEHTSELQSRLHLVCRLLLEKKKSTTIFSLMSDCIRH